MIRTLALGVLVFYFTALEETISVRRMHAITAKRPVASGIWCAIFAGVILVSLASLLQSKWLVIPYILGSGLGGWHAVTHAKEAPNG